MDLVTPILDILTKLWGCTSNRIAITRHLEENLASLKEARRELEDINQDVKSRVELAEQQYRERTKEVKGWLEGVQLKLEAVDNMMLRAEQEIQKKCLGTCCPRNCRSSYKIGDQVIKETVAVKESIEKGKKFKTFDDVSYKLPPLPVDEISVKKTTGMDSILDEVWRCIEDHEVRMIGIYGTGGVGKTTLLQKFNNKFIDERRDFDVLIWVTVSKEVNLNGIQEVIRNKLEIPDEIWKSKTDGHGRATEIFRSLSRKKFLLLLDDLWQPIDLQNVGVPDLSSHQNGSKIAFTTRSEDVCDSMDAAVKKFEVKCLSFKESFELFRQCVKEDVLNSHHEIPELAKIVTEECKGLPLVLITVGRAMSCRRTPAEWQYAINTLQSHPSEFSDMESRVFQVLKFSYDSLRDDKHKYCFLYCSMFPEDHMIRKDELIELWIGEGILLDYGLEYARNEGEYIIGSLKNACLLEKVGHSNDYVKMHDVLRDMAMWIALEKKNKILVHDKKHGIDAWKEAVRVSMWGNSIDVFRETPSCARLLTLLVRETMVKTFPSSFFQSMHDGTNRLKAISEGVISSLSSLKVFSRVPTRAGDLDFQPFWNTTLLQELECLKDIEEISLTLFTIDAVFQFNSSPKLQSCVKRLVILCNQGKELYSPNTSSLDLSSGCFSNLHDLYIKNCLVKDLTCLRYASQLRFVFADNCPLLEEIIAKEFSSSSEDANMFKNLKHLNFINLPLLKSICRVMLFPSLEMIYVDNCPSLKKLPLHAVSENNSRISIVGSQVWWDKLDWEHSSSKVSSPSMLQTASILGLTAESSSYYFPHFTEIDKKDLPSYTYEATKFEFDDIYFRVAVERFIRKQNKFRHEE